MRPKPPSALAIQSRPEAAPVESHPHAAGAIFPKGLRLTVYDDNERIVDALCAGACGYLLKKTPWPKLMEALKEVVDCGSPMSPEVARRVISLFREIKPPQKADYELTP